ncbi:MAG: cytochrome b/b6 domain-containing protein [Acidobacteriota bacterium]|nr:cytochrome b/b6 domain-containing protein [Acidobacteriota bacterium]
MSNNKPLLVATGNYATGAVVEQKPPLTEVAPRAGLAVDGREFVRFQHLYRVLHAFMIVSFLTLAVTGLSLKFSYTPWAAKFSRLLGGFETAGYIHRFAAVVMFGTFTAHVIGLFKQKKRNQTTWKAILLGPNTLLPTKRDGQEFVATVKWFIGFGPRPQYGRWTYWEKFDYFAVFWGIVVIGSTGLTLWFPVFFTRFLPGPFINVATIIHSDEALLATGFIFTVHFFNTHLRPEKFPMDTTIFTGHMPLAEFKRDKPREYAELVASGTLEEHLEQPQPEIVVKAIRAFAWIALTIGFIVVIWIIYAMLFAYR